MTDPNAPEQPPSPPGWWKASDGNWYPPEAAPAATSATAEPSGQAAEESLLRRPVTMPLWALVLAALITLAAGASASGSGDGSTQASAGDDGEVRELRSELEEAKRA